MSFASFVASAIGGILILSPIVGVAAQEPSRSGWYLGGGIGLNWASEMDQEGWNRDPICYPTDACFDANPARSLDTGRAVASCDTISGWQCVVPRLISPSFYQDDHWPLQERFDLNPRRSEKFIDSDYIQP